MTLIPPGENIIEKNICRLSGQEFFVTDKDIAYLAQKSPLFEQKKYTIPTPTLSPEERQRRRLAWRNERQLYHRTCDKIGVPIITIYSPDKPYTVYDQKVWWGDTWSPNEYGISFDFEKNFFEQLQTLHHHVPQINLIASQNENCDFTNLTANCRNCYLIYESSNNEFCEYGCWFQKSDHCIDCALIHDCKYCYEVSDSYSCHSLFWSQNCDNCRESQYLSNCLSCSHCFGCVNLVNKSYYIFNTEVTPAQYDAFLKKFSSCSISEQKKYLQKYAELDMTSPKRWSHILQGENCTGDYIRNCKNCFECFHAYDAEDCKYAEHAWRNSRHNRDISTAGRNSEWHYESINVGIDAYNNSFCVQNWTCSNHFYCISCFNSHDNFGCISLKKHDHCILNTPYSTQEYEALCGKIIDHMISTGEWWEFFPHHLSPFWYNETVAQEYFPMTESEVKAKGWNWHIEEEKKFEWQPYIPFPISQYDERVVGFDTATRNINECLTWTVQCEVTGKPFKIIKQELVFYIENSIPIPMKHPDQRHKERMGLRNPKTLYERTCAECGKNIMTTYSPERPEKVVCDECYRGIVY